MRWVALLMVLTVSAHAQDMLLMPRGEPPPSEETQRAWRAQRDSNKAKAERDKASVLKAHQDMVDRDRTAAALAAKQ